MFDSLHDGNFLLYAAKWYDNPQCYDQSEFYEDLNRFKYLKRLFNKYADSKELRERLILTHITVIYNVFGSRDPSIATRMLFFKLNGFESYLKPFLVFLNYMPEKITGIGLEGNDIISSDIIMDQKIIEALRKI